MTRYNGAADVAHANGTLIATVRAELDSTDTRWGGAIEAEDEAQRNLVTLVGRPLTLRLPSGKTGEFHITAPPVSLGQPLVIEGHGPSPLED